MVAETLASLNRVEMLVLVVGCIEVAPNQTTAVGGGRGGRPIRWAHSVACRVTRSDQTASSSRNLSTTAAVS